MAGLASWISLSTQSRVRSGDPAQNWVGIRDPSHVLRGMAFFFVSHCEKRSFSFLG